MVIAASALVVAVVALTVGAVLSARPPAQPVPSLDGYFDRWQALHGNVDPRGNTALRGWLVVAFAVARPLARRGVQPDLLTLWGLWFAGAALVAAAAGDRWLLLAGAAVVASGLGDTVDGAVAALTGRSSAFGYVLDSVVDRVDDAFYLAAVWIAGAPGWLAVATAAVCWLLEYLRARAAGVGAGPVGVVTVGERANRVIFCAAGLVSAGLFPSRDTLLVTASTGALAVLSLVGFAQLFVAIHRRLSGAG